jgi:hypothetical protein
MGIGEDPGEPDKYNPDIPRPTVLEDSGVGAASPGAALLGTPAPVPRITKSYIELPALSPSQGGASATSTPAAPYGSSPAPDTSIADATTSH